MTQQLSGVLTALATPFTADDQIDEALLRRLVDRSIDGGVAGVVACGSTGEFAAMTGAVTLQAVVSAIAQKFSGEIADRNVLAANAAYEYVQDEVRELTRA